MHARFHTVLIANRGEIALRIARSCRALGLGVVAVFSDADDGAPWVRAADRAVRLGPAPAAASYLATDRLIAAARASGADAIHPGYGFLSESAAFAGAVRDAGLVFIGPPTEVIRRLGSKIEAKAAAVLAGVPVVPGFDPARPAEMRFPVLVKASAGGGGKGMRIVRDAAGLEAALAAGGREALAAFGDGTLLVERLVERPRHVEIQILADEHGAVLHLGERECSIQRRHQKIVEESPSPGIDGEARARMVGAAVALARAVGYVSAGTVEMIVAPDGAFYFLEVNTRLQVEHPVTEAVTGLDLVREQLRVAQGEPLGFGQDEVRSTGHAVEVRLYAEDPATGFLPTSGRILDWSWPDDDGLRVDAGVAVGSEVGIHYDPMLAKVIAHAGTRGEALARLARALDRASVLGVTTNQAFLARLLRDPELVAGATDTGYLERHPELAAAAPTDDAVARAATAATIASVLTRQSRRARLPALRPAFRNNAAAGVPAEEQRFRLGDREVAVRFASLAVDAFAVEVGAWRATVRVAWRTDPELGLELDGLVHRFRVAPSAPEADESGGDGRRIWVHDGATAFALDELPRFPRRIAALAAGDTSAPMPGRVVRLLAEVGQRVAAGQALVVLEAMKMEHTVSSPRAGTVARLLVAEGDQVLAGAPLVALVAD
jgi:propionyl-CoA carboxylase alpha chain